MVTPQDPSEGFTNARSGSGGIITAILSLDVTDERMFEDRGTVFKYRGSGVFLLLKVLQTFDPKQL